MLRTIAAGIASGLQFHPLFAAATAALAAALAGYRKAPRSRSWYAAGVVLAGWAIGDGLRIAGSTAAVLTLVAWVAASLALGYALPTLLGAYVGRQVHRGTGYLAAAVVAIMFVSAFSVLAGPIADALMRAAS